MGVIYRATDTALGREVAVGLPKFKKTAEELTTALDRWCYFLRHGAELDPDNLPASLDVPEIRQALEVLAMFTKDENEREIYELRLKYKRDHDSLVQDAVDRGYKRGELMGEIYAYQMMLKRPLTPREELRALTTENLTALLDQLRKELWPNGT